MLFQNLHAILKCGNYGIPESEWNSKKIESSRNFKVFQYEISKGLKFP